MMILGKKCRGRAICLPLKKSDIKKIAFPLSKPSYSQDQFLVHKLGSEEWQFKFTFA